MAGLRRLDEGPGIDPAFGELGGDCGERLIERICSSLLTP